MMQGKAASEFAVHVREMSHLVEFSMKKDCTMDILSAIVHSSARSLRSDIFFKNFIQPGSGSRSI
jgi:hypothetical protein